MVQIKSVDICPKFVLCWRWTGFCWIYSRTFPGLDSLLKPLPLQKHDDVISSSHFIELLIRLDQLIRSVNSNVLSKYKNSQTLESTSYILKQSQGIRQSYFQSNILNWDSLVWLLDCRYHSDLSSSRRAKSSK